MLSFIFRICKFFRHRDSFLCLYKSLMHTLFRYHITKFMLIELNQYKKDFSDTLTTSNRNKTALTYSASLHHYNLLSWTNKRCYLEIILVYKIIHNYTDSSLFIEKFSFNIPQFNARIVNFGQYYYSLRNSAHQFCPNCTIHCCLS